MRIYGKSYPGKRHSAQGKPCQDAWKACQTPDGWTVAAIADGVGASNSSELGSRTAVESVMEYFSAFCSPYLDDESLEQALRDAFNYALRRVKQATEAADAEAYSGLTTLHVLLYGERIGLHWGQCGDGALFLRGDVGLWKRLTTPMKDEEDGTAPVTLQQSAGKWEFGHLHTEGLSVIMLATDGLAEAIYDQSQTPQTRRAAAELVMHPQSGNLDDYYDALFFGNAPEAADESPEASARRRLLAIDDDITLLTLALTDDEPPPAEPIRPPEHSLKPSEDKAAGPKKRAGAPPARPPQAKPQAGTKHHAASKAPSQQAKAFPRPAQRAKALPRPAQPSDRPARRRPWWRSRGFQRALWIAMGVGVLLMIAGIVLKLIARLGL